MFEAGTVASLTSAQSLVQDTQKDVNKEAQQITKKEIAQHDQNESSTELTTGSDHK
jgi:hypothetical protein